MFLLFLPSLGNGEVDRSILSGGTTPQRSILAVLGKKHNTTIRIPMQNTAGTCDILCGKPVDLEYGSFRVS